MGSILSRLLTIVVGIAGTAAGVYFLMQSWEMLKQFPSEPAVHAEAGEGEHGAPADGHGGGHGGGGGEHGGGHGAAADAGHGAPADGHGAPAGGHGAPAEGHGAAAADHGGGHGAPAAGEHGAPAGHDAGRAPVSVDKKVVPRTWVTMDQMFVNLAGPDNEGHSLTFQIEIELFEEGKRQLLEGRLATLKNAAIEVARDQSFARLKTLSGKLYFKESLVSAMNESLHSPIIRDIHMGTIYLK